MMIVNAKRCFSHKRFFIPHWTYVHRQFGFLFESASEQLEETWGTQIRNTIEGEVGGSKDHEGLWWAITVFLLVLDLKFGRHLCISRKSDQDYEI